MSHGFPTASMLLVLLSLAWPSYAQQQAGYVLDVRGNWRIARVSATLSIGQTLKAGDAIRIEVPGIGDYIVIADLKGNIVISRRCEIAGECGSQIIFEGSTKSQSSKWSVLLDSVMGLLLGEPDRYSIHRNRGDEELSDRVVRLNGDRVDFRSVLAGKKKGKYYVQLRTLAKERRASRNSIGPLVIDWDPRKPAVISIDGIHAGLYELSLLAPQDGGSFSTASSAWVLVSPQDQYRRLAASFDAAAALTKQWRQKISAEAARSFLRAHLDHLAMSVGG